MINLFLTIFFSFTCGQAAYYNQGVMESVVANRQHYEQLPMDIPPVIGFVALNDCSEIGSFVWLWYEEELAGPYWVTDCRAQEDVAAAKRKNIVVEVDYNTAKRWKVLGYDPSQIDVIVIPIVGEE